MDVKTILVLLINLFICDEIVCELENCANALTWCQSLTTGRCQANIGTVIVIPCGDSVSSELSLTYINQTAQDLGDPNVLVRNTTKCLEINLTVYDDRTRIACEASNAMGALFSFLIVVNYSPRIMAPVTVKRGGFLMKYSLECPLVGNPLPSYIWEARDCFERYLVDIDGIKYSSDNRTVKIKTLTLDYSNVCFVCNATNSLGHEQYFFSSIQYDYCAASGNEILLTPNQPVVNVSVGTNITLDCTVTGVNFPNGNLFWMFNNSTSISELTPHYNFTTCLGSLKLVLSNVTFEDFGNYTCGYFTNFGSSSSRTIQIQHLFDTITTTNTINDIKSSLLVSMVLLLVILLSTILIVLLFIFFQRKYRKKYKKSLALAQLIKSDDIKDPEYDVFISFAEEDREFAEFQIKYVLEKKGYKISWHHEVFIPGCSIIENMTKFIFQSRITVVLISGSFHASEFCLKELYIALQKEEQNAFTCIVPILLNPSCTLPEVLIKKTYLSADDKNFIERLCTAIGEPLDPSP